MSVVDICRLELNGHRDSPVGSLCSFSTFSLLGYINPCSSLSVCSYLLLSCCVSTINTISKKFWFGFAHALHILTSDIPLSNWRSLPNFCTGAGQRLQTFVGFDFEEGLQVLCANSWHQISMNMHHKLHADICS